MAREQRFVLLTPRQIQGIEPGRVEIGNLIVHSGAQAFRQGTNLRYSQLKLDTHIADQVVVHIERNGLAAARDFMEFAVKQGKETIFVTCACDAEAKAQVARETGAKIMAAPCDDSLAVIRQLLPCYAYAR